MSPHYSATQKTVQIWGFRFGGSDWGFRFGGPDLWRGFRPGGSDLGVQARTSASLPGISGNARTEIVGPDQQHLGIRRRELNEADAVVDAGQPLWPPLRVETEFLVISQPGTHLRRPTRTINGPIVLALLFRIVRIKNVSELVLVGPPQRWNRTIGGAENLGRGVRH